MQRWQRAAAAVRAGATLALAVLVTGCASIVSGQTQVVSVDTPGCPGARCELVNDKGRFFVGSTPGTVSLQRSYNNLQVTCTRAGARSDPVSVASTTKGMAFGNILFGGVIGAGVDVGTGAAYDYPQMITVPMACGPVADAPAPAPPRLGLQLDQDPGGVRVVAVEPGLPAAAAGLRAGDLVLRVQGLAVADPAAMAARLADPANPPPWRIVVRRDGQDIELTLGAPTPPAPATRSNPP